MKIEVTAEKPACYGCWHYNGQFSDFPSATSGGYCKYEKHNGGQGDFFVEADHYCKRFTLTNPEMPTTLIEAVKSIEARLDNETEDDTSNEYTLIEILSEEWETPEQAIRTFFNNHFALDWKVGLNAQWHCRRGDGWGAYHGPTPDEYTGHVYVEVLDEDGAKMFSEEGTHEDVMGGVAAAWIAKRLTAMQKAA